MSGAIPPLTNMPSRRGAQLKHRDNITLLWEQIEFGGYLLPFGAGVAQWATGWSRVGLESRHGLGIFLFTIASRPALGPTQPPIQWLPGAFPWG